MASPADYQPVGGGERYQVKIAKVVVGGVRFVFEDSLQAICQGIYLCKRWLKLSTSTRLFTVASISVGIFLSLVGPLKEWCGLKKITDRDKIQKQGSRGCDQVVPRYVLTLMAGVFWGSMAAYSYAYGDDITCEGDNPAQPLRLFIGYVVFDVCVQISVVKVQGGSLGGCLGGIIFTCLARYDTFADVVFTARLNDCEDITWFSIWGTKFTMPFPLQGIALFALIVGVFVCQALPALCLIVCTGLTPIALKFNDFNVVLVTA